MISKLILVFIAVVQLLAGGWAASIAFANNTLPISTLAMMGMLGSLFHSTVLFASLKFRLQERKLITLLLLLWHLPEAILIATLGMGIPVDQRPFGIATHLVLALLALLSWYLAKEE